MRYMVDSTNIYDDPTSYALVAYYCDGNFAISEAAVRARFPHAILVPVSAVGTNAGVVGDCEPGCMTEDELVTWVVERRAAGVDPTGYVNEMHGWIPARQAFARRGVGEPHWWVADYDGLDVIPAGAVAKQDKNSAMTGGHFDKSVVADYWPGVDGAFGMDPMEVSDLDATQDLRLTMVYNDMVGGSEDNPKGVAATVHRIEAKLAAPATDLSSIVQAANDAKAAAQAAQAAAEGAAQALQAASNVIAAAAADIKAVRAKTDADLK